MAQKIIDFSDVNQDLHTFKLPFRNAEGEIEVRELVVHDPKTAVVLLLEQMRDHHDKVQEQHKKDGKRLSIKFQRKFFEETALMLFEIDNNVTPEEIATLPFSTLVNITNWVKGYMSEIFLGDSPTSNTNDSSNQEQESPKEQEKTTSPSASSE